MTIEGMLPYDVMSDFKEALKKVPEAQDAFDKGEVRKAAGILVSHGQALLDEGNLLGGWFRNVGIEVRCDLPFNP